MSMTPAPRVVSAIALAIIPLFASSQPSSNPSPQQLASLDPVVVTASRYEEPLSAAGVLIDIIDRQRVLDSGVSSVTEILDQIPGVSVRRLYGRLGADASIDIGALGEAGAKNVLVLIDGLRINNIDDESVRFGQLPISAIERIEVRGAGAGVLYGDRAMGGVVNIITRRDPGNELHVSAGSFGSHSADAYLAGNLGGATLGLSVMDARSNGYRERSRVEQQSARISLRSDPSAQTSWVVQARMFEERAQLPGGISIAKFQTDPRAARNPADSGQREGGHLSLEGQRNLGSDIRVSLTGGYDFSRNYADMQSFLPFSSAISTRESTKLFLQPALLWDAGFGTVVRAGFDSFIAEANVNGGNQVTQDTLAAYLTTETRLSPVSTVLLGARRQSLANHFKVNLTSPEDRDRKYLTAYSIGWMGRLTESATARVGYISGFRFPTTDELYYFNANSFVPTRLNPGVKPMTSEEFYATIESRQHSRTYSASLREIRTDGEIGFSPSAGCSPVVVNEACNTNLYDTYRLVMSLGGRWDLSSATNVNLTLDWVDSEIKSGVNSGFRIPYVPRTVSRLGINQDISHGLKFSGRVHYRARMYQNDYFTNLSDRGYEIPGRTLIDVGLIGQPRPKVQWGFWIRNAADRRYYDFGRDGSNAWGGVYPGDGRSFHLNGIFKF
ncbi:MAG: TonB-dependent receptor [Burkholderiaceae bacterium]|nr:TonB-dependent receptor [Burkholderiaceae bacterium]